MKKGKKMLLDATGHRLYTFTIVIATFHVHYGVLVPDYTLPQRGWLYPLGINSIDSIGPTISFQYSP